MSYLILRVISSNLFTVIYVRLRRYIQCKPVLEMIKQYLWSWKVFIITSILLKESVTRTWKFVYRIRNRFANISTTLRLMRRARWMLSSCRCCRYKSVAPKPWTNIAMVDKTTREMTISGLFISPTPIFQRITGPSNWLRDNWLSSFLYPCIPVLFLLLRLSLWEKLLD